MCKLYFFVSLPWNTFVWIFQDTEVNYENKGLKMEIQYICVPCSLQNCFLQNELSSSSSKTTPLRWGSCHQTYHAPSFKPIVIGSPPCHLLSFSTSFRAWVTVPFSRPCFGYLNTHEGAVSQPDLSEDLYLQAVSAIDFSGIQSLSALMAELIPRPTFQEHRS